MLTATLPYCEGDLILAALDKSDVHVDMADVLRQGSPWAGDGYETGFDGDGNVGGDYEFFGLEDVPHLHVK